MTTKFLTSLIFLFCLSQSYSFSIPDKDLVLSNIGKQVIVILKNTSLDTLLIEDEAVKQKEENIMYNESVKKYFTKYWKATEDTVIFMTNKEINLLSAEKAINSIFIYSHYKKISEKTEGYRWKIITLFEKKFEISLLTIDYGITANISESDILFFIQQANNFTEASLNNYTTFYEMIDLDKTVETIKNKTLFIDSLLTKSKVKKLSRHYHGDVRIVSTEEINDSILNFSSNCLYIKRIKNWMWWGLFDAEKGNIIGVSSVGGMTVSASTGNPKRSIQRTVNNGYVSYNYELNPNRFNESNGKFMLYNPKKFIGKTQLNIFDGKMQRVNLKMF